MTSSIDYDELRAAQRRGAVLVDVLPRESFAASHIPGARSLPLEEIPERAEFVLPDRETEIVVYCRNEDCDASPRAAALLEEMGWREVKDYQGGLEDWMARSGQDSASGAHAHVRAKGSRGGLLVDLLVTNRTVPQLLGGRG